MRLACVWLTPVGKRLYGIHHALHENSRREFFSEKIGYMESDMKVTPHGTFVPTCLTCRVRCHPLLPLCSCQRARLSDSSSRVLSGQPPEFLLQRRSTWRRFSTLNAPTSTSHPSQAPAATAVYAAAILRARQRPGPLNSCGSNEVFLAVRLSNKLTKC